MPAEPDSGRDPVGIDAALEETESGVLDTSGERPTALGSEGANRLCARRRQTVVVLAGSVATGKTSVYAALYERFGRGPFGGRLFAGSTTIPGFEKRCHGWRIASGYSEPKMEHTKLGDLQWLHMQIRDSEREHPTQDLLFGDYNGEIFDGMASGAESDYSFLRRADHVGVILDGGKLCDPTQREATLQRTIYLLDELKKPGRLAEPGVLFVVLTKLDLFVDGPDAERERAEEAIEQVMERVREVTGEEPPLLRLAARSESDRFPVGHGLNELLDLVTEEPAAHVQNDPAPLPGGDFFSEFRV
jgi:Double-GTPase 2